MHGDIVGAREKTEQEFLNYLSLLSDNQRQEVRCLLGRYIDQMNQDATEGEPLPC